MCLENILAVENREAFGMCALGGEEDVGRQAHQGRFRGAQLMRVPGNDGSLVSEEQT